MPSPCSTGAIAICPNTCTPARAPGTHKRIRPSRNHDTVEVKQNPVRGCCASLGRHRNSHPPARPPHNIETPTGPIGRPWYATASQVTNAATMTPDTPGPATRPAAQTATMLGLNQPLCPTTVSSTSPRTMKTNSAVPRSRTDIRERSDRLKPGISANAAVTNTQTLLKTISSPISVIRKGTPTYPPIDSPRLVTTYPEVAPCSGKAAESCFRMKIVA